MELQIKICYYLNVKKIFMVKGMILISLMIIIPMVTFASTLTLKVIIDKSQYNVGDTVTATVDWTEEMQAASFVVRYDSDVLEFKASSVGEEYYNIDTEGKILVNWFSLNNRDLTNIKFEFKTLKTGNADISINDVDGFSDGDMKTPTDYEFSSIGKVNVVANSNNPSNEENKQNDNGNTSNQNNNGTTDKETKSIEEAKKAYSTQGGGSKTNSKLPKAGVSTFVIPIVIIGVFGILGYIKYKRLSGI